MALHPDEHSPDEPSHGRSTVRRGLGRAGVVDVEVGWLEPAGLDDVDALARLQLAAMRRGARIRLRHPSEGLLDLLRLAGLADVFEPSAAGEMPSRAGFGDSS